MNPPKIRTLFALAAFGSIVFLTSGFVADIASAGVGWFIIEAIRESAVLNTPVS